MLSPIEVDNRLGGNRRNMQPSQSSLEINLNIIKMLYACAYKYQKISELIT